eukprot:CAMPEP_0114505910 /NCGR_PEP_ID=MMETSP0109-20121206/11120_1 /TAXON_ID=29199 /ORGANISM="Chlorarachnion reptans, Strain CCCM449" /LENGTH=136 /DNA_ID=CAMNT_0001684411 /DNA_START=46 /DNA_END=453 /DNA_ORIENTATION=+
MNEAGQTYEYDSIVEWYAMGERTDPLTRKPISNIQILLPNHHAKSQIEEWKKKYLTSRRKRMEPVLPITDKEHARMVLFEKHLQLTNLGKSKIEQALQKLSRQKAQDLSRLNKEFAKLKEKVSREHGICLEAATSK